MQIFDNFILDENLSQFCFDFSQNNEPSMSYVDGVLEEFYSKTNMFVGNFNFEYTCIGKINADVPEHIDEGRESTLIIPFNTLSIVTDSIVHQINKPFLLDTTKLHGAKAEKDSLFLAIDFRKKYKEALDYLLKFDKLELRLL